MDSDIFEAMHPEESGNALFVIRVDMRGITPESSVLFSPIRGDQYEPSTRFQEPAGLVEEIPRFPEVLNEVEPHDQSRLSVPQREWILLDVTAITRNLVLALEALKIEWIDINDCEVVVTRPLGGEDAMALCRADLHDEIITPQSQPAEEIGDHRSMERADGVGMVALLGHLLQITHPSPEPKASMNHQSRQERDKAPHTPRL